MQARIPVEGLIPVSQGGSVGPCLLCGSCPGMVLPREIHEDLFYPRLAAVVGSIPVCLTCRENKAGMSSGAWVSPGPFLGWGMCWWDARGRAEQGIGGLAPFREHLLLFQW